MKKTLLVILTILSVLLFIFGLFHIPILSSFGVEFPARNVLWGLSIIPTVIVSAIPLIICGYLWIKSKNCNKNTQQNQEIEKKSTVKKLLFRVLEVVKFCLILLMDALFFIEIGHDVDLLPNNEGKLEKVDYYYSIYDKLYGKNLQFLVYIALVVMSVSIVMSIVTCVAKDNRKLRIASHVTFLIAAIIFLILLVYSTLYLKISY